MTTPPTSAPGLDETFSAPPTDEDRLRYRLAKVLPVTTGKERNIDALVAAGVVLPDTPPRPTMTPAEGIAYLYGTLPARPELYDNSEHTAALIALGPLVDATGRMDTAAEPLVGGIAACEVCGAGGCDAVHEAPAEPLFTGTVESLYSYKVIRVYAGLNVQMGDRVDVYPAGVHPAAPTVTAEFSADMVYAVMDIFMDAGWEMSAPDVWASDAVADALNRLLAEQGGEG